MLNVVLLVSSRGVFVITGVFIGAIYIGEVGSCQKGVEEENTVAEMHVSNFGFPTMGMAGLTLW